MKISKIASLIVVGALVAPLSSYAADSKPAGTAKVWV